MTGLGRLVQRAGFIRSQKSSASRIGPGAVGGLFGGQYVCGSRIAGQAARRARPPGGPGRPAGQAAVAAWIEDYNHDRRHSALGMLSPVAYELALAAEDAA
jgi:integrase-like protein